jgi:hypothetical protein
VKQYTEQAIQKALSRHFDWRKVKCYRNVCWGWGITDFLAVSEAGYATEVEIKISLSDWKADAAKPKWKHPQKSSMFYYAVPHYLMTTIPAHVRPEWGIMAVKTDDKGDLYVDVWRKAEKVMGRINDKDRQNLANHTYFHYWEKVAVKL